LTTPLNNDRIRLSAIRRSADYRIQELEFLNGAYREWVSYNEYLVLEVVSRSPYDHNEKSQEYIAVKCAKRGNDVYAHKVRERLDPINKACKRLENVKKSKDRGIRSTNMLYVTLTYDIKLCSMADAWYNIGVEWNRFMAGLRKKYGKVSILRSWESYENGYPHIHAFLIFKEREFRTWLHTNKKGKNTWRIPSTDKNQINDIWHSYVDVQAVVDVKEGIKNVLWYIGKDLTKDIDNINDKEILTFVALWYFGKQSFSVSGDFPDLIKGLCIIKTEVGTIAVQTTIEGEKFEIEFKFLGVIGSDVIQIYDNSWVKVYEKRPIWVDELIENRKFRA
jgi:hypothetical protein